MRIHSTLSQTVLPSFVINILIQSYIFKYLTIFIKVNKMSTVVEINTVILVIIVGFAFRQIITLYFLNLSFGLTVIFLCKALLTHIREHGYANGLNANKETARLKLTC